MVPRINLGNKIQMPLTTLNESDESSSSSTDSNHSAFSHSSKVKEGMPSMKKKSKSTPTFRRAKSEIVTSYSATSLIPVNKSRLTV